MTDGRARYSDPSGYELIPTSTHGLRYPIGWVRLPKGSHPKRRMMTEGYLNTRMPRSNTIAMNQHYVLKVLENPKTPSYNRNAVIDYVLNHREKFIPLCDCTEDPVVNEWARKKNADASWSFMDEFRRRYLSF